MAFLAHIWYSIKNWQFKRLAQNLTVLGNSNITHKVSILPTRSMKGFYCGKLKLGTPKINEHKVIGFITLSTWTKKVIINQQLQDTLGFCISEAYDAFEIRWRETATSMSVDQTPSEGFCWARASRTVVFAQTPASVGDTAIFKTDVRGWVGTGDDNVVFHLRITVQWSIPQGCKLLSDTFSL